MAMKAKKSEKGISSVWRSGIKMERHGVSGVAAKMAASENESVA